MNDKGFTLIEIMVSVVILSIIVVSLLSFFVQSSRSNSMSNKMIDSTYIAQTNIEDINKWNKSFTPSTSPTADPVGEFKTFLMDGKGYDSDSSCTNCLKKEQDNRIIQFQLSSVLTAITAGTSTKELGKVVVIVYDSSKTKKEAQMELVLSWND